jgi:hypothetical protein
MAMTQQEAIDQLVPELNARINIPGIWSEEAEAEKIRYGLELIMPSLPPIVYEFMVSASDGLTDAEVDRFTEITLTGAVRTAMAPLPQMVQVFVGSQLRTFLEPLVKIVFEYAQVGANLGLEQPDGD